MIFMRVLWVHIDGGVPMNQCVADGCDRNRAGALNQHVLCPFHLTLATDLRFTGAIKAVPERVE